MNYLLDQMKQDTLNAHNTGEKLNHVEVTCQMSDTTAELVFSQIEGCKGDDVKVVWQVYHHI